MTYFKKLSYPILSFVPDKEEIMKFIQKFTKQ